MTNLDTSERAARIEAARAKLAAAREKKIQQEKAFKEASRDVKRAAIDLEKKQREAKELKDLRIQLYLSAENEEDKIANQLTKKLDALSREKEALQAQAEKEEEYIKNNLERKLDSIKREKIDMENRLEQEQEQIINRLQKDLIRISAEKAQLQKRLCYNRAALLQKMGERAASMGNSDAVDRLHGDIKRLLAKNDRAEQHIQAYDTECRGLHKLLDDLRSEAKVREREEKGLAVELHKVVEERKNLFVQAEQLMEKRINNKLRTRRSHRTKSRNRSVSELSAADSLSSSVCSSAISTPKLTENFISHSSISSVGNFGPLSSAPPTAASDPKQRSSSVPLSFTLSDKNPSLTPTPRASGTPSVTPTTGTAGAKPRFIER
ncbi:PH domain-containing rcdII [Diplonema papillatum]|nr:PH domain-containing rcdII [Diplonema papillatum]KAJ9453577.1 PH domain-containing rcdII [Diplonema papillatum]